ncbi:MAG: MoxR family ATPase [Methanomicrobiaceae archaeon]|nr:MoxR family ATPase [Methanomicrobiaceae archaeon]
MTEKELKENIEFISEKFLSLRTTCAEFIVGNESLIEALCIGVLADGHVLIEGIPGTAKTSIVKVISYLLGCESKRVQCSVDMQPSDIIGIRIWNSETRTFELNKGPLFTNILLVDEINRLPPRSQSAFIEAMSESQATIDGITIPLKKPFLAIATQNPFEQEGTFPLIEAQKDRFMLCIRSQFLKKEGEMEIIRRANDGMLDLEKFLYTTKPVISPGEIIRAQKAVKSVKVSDPVQKYIGDLVIASREHGDVRLGISSRGTISLLKGAKAFAAMNKRDYVIPDDVKYLAGIAFPHRLILNYEAEISGLTPEVITSQILDTIEVP